MEIIAYTAVAFIICLGILAVIICPLFITFNNTQQCQPRLPTQYPTQQPKIEKKLPEPTFEELRERGNRLACLYELRPDDAINYFLGTPAGRAMDLDKRMKLENILCGIDKMAIAKRDTAVAKHLEQQKLNAMYAEATEAERRRAKEEQKREEEMIMLGMLAGPWRRK